MDDVKPWLERDVTVALEGMKFYAYHGVTDEEKKEGRWFEVDCHLRYPSWKGVKSDDLAGTLNYASVAEIVGREMSVTSNLIEHVAGRIINALVEEYPQIRGGIVKVSKLNPPGCGDTDRASVTLEW